MDIIGEDYQRVCDIKTAIEIFKLNLLAYPDSADANDDLANPYHSFRIAIRQTRNGPGQPVMGFLAKPLSPRCIREKRNSIIE